MVISTKTFLSRGSGETGSDRTWGPNPGTDLKVVHDSSAVTGTLDVATGLASLDEVTGVLATAPGVGAGDPYLIQIEKDTPIAGTIRISLFQDDATAATNAGTVSWIAIGT